MGLTGSRAVDRLVEAGSAAIDERKWQVFGKDP